MNIVFLSVALLSSGAGADYFTRGLGPLPVMSAQSAAECGECHREIYTEWARSRHATAWTNTLFQGEFQQRPLQWCVNCHAPNDVQQRELEHATNSKLANEGVSCQSCHVRRGKIHAAAKSVDSPHGTIVVPRFGNAEWCGGCHQFNFPVVRTDGTVTEYTEFPMQDTVRQFTHRKNQKGVRDCRGCHATSPAGHSYPGAHDPRMLERALSMEVCRAKDDELTVRVRNSGAGHNVPTGDVHRHIAVRVWRPTAPERMYEGYIGRRYEPVEAGGRRTIWDSTLAAGTAQRHQIKVSALGGVASEPIEVELRYVYVAREFPLAGHGPEEPTYRTVYRKRVVPGRLGACGEAHAQAVSTSTSESGRR